MMAMAKAEEMRNRFGSNMAESMGANRIGRAGEVATEARPDKDEGTSPARSVRTIEIERIAPDPDQPREEITGDELDRLVVSLQEHGQLQPISVRWSEDDGKYLIIAGERRYQAARKAGLKVLEAKIKNNLNPQQVFEEQVVENCDRKDLTPIEQAKAFRKLMDQFHWSAEKIGKRFNRSESTVLKATALLELPEPVQKLVAEKRLPPATAYEVSKAPASEQQPLAERIVDEGMSRAEAVKIVDQTRAEARSKPTGKGGASKANGKAKLPTSRVFRVDGGYRITIERAKGIEATAILAALVQATEMVRGGQQGPFE